VLVFLNGAQVERKRAGGDWTLDFLVRTADLDGIELHTGPEGPLLDEDGCGVLLLWSDAPLLRSDVPFTGTVEGTFWGDGAELVSEVTLEPGGQRATFDRNGEFVFREIRPGLHWVVVKTAAGPVSRERVRVYAFARSWIDVPIGQMPERGRGPGRSRHVKVATTGADDICLSVRLCAGSRVGSPVPSCRLPSIARPPAEFQ
jgi:hypothetical protein